MGIFKWAYIYSFCRCGPLKHMWCMRFEAKHSYFKHLARVVGNFKNIAKTLAHRHQHYMCYQLMNDTYLQHDTKFTGGKCKAFQSKIKNNSTCCRKTIVFGGDRTLPTASANGARFKQSSDHSEVSSAKLYSYICITQ